VEDDEDQFLLARELLTGSTRARFIIEWCRDYASGVGALRERRHDVNLIDVDVRGRPGIELMRDGLVSRPSTPTILLTDDPEYEIDLEATALGVLDFLVKCELDTPSLERAIRYAVTHHRAIAQLSRTEERWALAVRAANDGIWDWDMTHAQMYLSPRWHALLGRPDGAGAQHPRTWFDLVHDEDLPHLQAAIDAHVAGQTEQLHVEHRIRHADGQWRWILARGLAIRDEGGTVTRMAGSISDVTAHKTAERKLRHDALHDPLTGLPNRALFIDRADQVIKRAARDPVGGCAVMLLDVDRFKLVNESLGHTVGDRLLIELAARLAGVVRLGETVARVGGDEFTLVLEGVLDEEQAKIVAERVQSALRPAFDVDGHHLFVSASIGIALSGPKASAGELLRNADIAMYAAKRHGRQSFAIFNERMHRQVVTRLTRETELRDAVERSLLPIHYQPIVDLATGAICAFEALVRWPGSYAKIPPRDFIPIAEETGIIGNLGLHVLRTALSTLARWRAEGLVSPGVYVSVNVSGPQLEDPRLPAQVRAAIDAAGVPPDALRLEITESTLMREPDAMARIVSEVCAAGVGLQLDDFGTGYSSLTALHQFPVDTLKIDRSFVAAIDGERVDNDAIVRSTIALAHSLRLHVIAEGIEDRVQLRRLRTLGCEYGQGFLFSRPLSAERTRALLCSWSARDVAVIGDQVA
jgi:diguanylate cyclase (GGDEF)-like protein/PAS domain S-box-containing protein